MLTWNEMHSYAVLMQSVILIIVVDIVFVIISILQNIGCQIILKNIILITCAYKLKLCTILVKFKFTLKSDYQ